MKKAGILSLIILVFCSLVLCSCMFSGGEKRWKPVKPARQAFVHQVTWSDETMSVIARWYTGKTDNAQALVKANPTVNPDRMVPGTRVFIPKELLRTRKAMPREAVADFIKKPVLKKKSPPAAPVPVEPVPTPADEFELFGPR
jgi:hypothetical protein